MQQSFLKEIRMLCGITDEAEMQFWQQIRRTVLPFVTVC